MMAVFSLKFNISLTAFKELLIFSPPCKEFFYSRCRSVEEVLLYLQVIKRPLAPLVLVLFAGVKVV